MAGQFPETETGKEYTALKQEVMAFALQAVKDFITAGYSPEEVIKRLKTPEKVDSKLPRHDSSDTWRTYHYFFDVKDPVFKRFAKYMYDYCIQFINK